MNAKEKIENITISVKDKLISLGIEDKLISEIEWCLGSYASDRNPVGLYEKSGEALKILKNFKKSHPRKVSKKLLADIEGILPQ